MFTFSIRFVDPELSQCPPPLLNQLKNLKGTAQQNLNNDLEKQDLEAIISSIFSSKFYEVTLQIFIFIFLNFL